jgi:type II secretion system (T2SS) protein M
VKSRDPWATWLWRISLGLLLVNGLVFALLVVPARQQRQEQERHLLDLQRRVRTLQREGESSQAVLAAFREVEDYGQGFPPRADLMGIIGQLPRLARSLGVDVPTVEYKPSEVKDAGLMKVTVVMAVEGPYSKIRHYLYELETMRRHLVIERLLLRDPRGTSDLQVQLQLAVYLR